MRGTLTGVLCEDTTHMPLLLWHLLCAKALLETDATLHE